jgi:P27 family predicted phage terminase small subunit
MAGRRPKPTKQKKLSGNPGRRPLPPEPKLEAGIPTCPDWLSQEGKEEWRRLIPQLKKARMLVAIDRAALAACCQAWAEFEIATKTLDKEGRIIDEPIVRGGEQIGTIKKAHPAKKQQADALSRLKSLLIEFGLTPASRSKAAAGGEPENRDDPLQEFLGHGQSQTKR